MPDWSERETFLRARMVEARMNVAELADACEVTRPTLYAWFAGAVPAADRLLRLADALRLSGDDRAELYRLLGEREVSL